MRSQSRYIYLVALCVACTGCAALGSFGKKDASVRSPTSADLAQTGGAPTDPPALSKDAELQSRELYLNVVRGLEEQGKYHAALAYLSAYDGKYPHDPKSGLLRGAALLGVGELTEAESTFKSLTSGASEPGAYNGLGKVEASRGNWQAAASDFEKASQLQPAEPDFLNNYGFSLLKTSDLTQAEFALKEAFELAPGNDDLRNNLILCLHLEGKSDEANQLLLSMASASSRQSVTTALEQWNSPAGAQNQEGGQIDDREPDSGAGARHTTSLRMVAVGDGETTRW